MERPENPPKTSSPTFLDEVQETARRLDYATIEAVAHALARLRDRNGRLFIIGVGGSAANASHAVNDFRKIVGIEAYAPTDNVSALTARLNDEGWAGVFAAWLDVSRFRAEDAVLVFSVGGGNVEKNVSPNIVAALLCQIDGFPRTSVGGVIRSGWTVGIMTQASATRAVCPPSRPTTPSLLMVTNQPDVACGKLTRENVEEINRHVRDTLRLEGVLAYFTTILTRANVESHAQA